jgi:SsrA-binding protein
MSKSTGDELERKPVATNRRARFEYDLLETVECGIALRGSEVKTLRTGKCSLEEAFARLQSGELWLVNCEIPEYPQASLLNHEPRRERKLLLHKRELAKLIAKAAQAGMTMVPLAVYFKRGLVKVELAIGKGRKLHDKRQAIKKTEAQKEIRQALANRRR